MTQSKEKLIRLYHTLATRHHLGDDERRVFLSSWNVESSKDMSVAQLAEACKALSGAMIDTSLDKYRKRVIASIFGWFKLIGKQVDVEYAKGVACQASGYKRFNSIPKDKLISIYNTFTHKAKIFDKTGEIINDELEHLAFNN